MIYEYKCTQCGKVKEVKEPIAIDHIAPYCPQCGQKMARVYTVPAVIYLVSGFYTTDNRKKQKERND